MKRSRGEDKPPSRARPAVHGWRRLLAPFAALLPVALTLFVLWRAPWSESPSGTTAPDGAPTDPTAPPGRLVVVIIDSLREATLRADGVMPHLLELANQPEVWVAPLQTCSANFTVPCMQTMFEGRESPFVAGLHNYTGSEGEHDNLLSVARERDHGIALVSDHTMDSLYGATALESIDVSKWPISRLERDLGAVDRSVELMARPDIDLLVLHIPGTDNAAHYQRPGSEGYEAHFRAVDERLTELWNVVDWKRDSVVVAGDHGHDEHGHHSRDSIVVLAGRRFSEWQALHEMPTELEQTELRYLMSYAIGTPVPLSYEGRHLVRETTTGTSDVNPEARAHADRFVVDQRAAFRAAGYEAPTLGDAAQRHRQHIEQRDREAFWAGMPLWLCYVGWLLVAFTPSLRASRRATAAMVFGILALGIAELSSPASSAIATGALAIVVGWFAVRFSSLRRLAWLGAIVVAAATLGYAAKPWADFFHTRGGFQPQIILFYASLVFGGAALVWLRDGSPRRLPEGALCVGLFVLPSGVYYYQAGPNALWGLILGAVVWLAVRATSRRRAPLPLRDGPRPPSWRARGIALGLVASAVLLVMQESGGWEYHLFLVGWLKRGGTWVTISAFGAIAVYLTWLVPAGRGRVAVLAALSAGLGYSVGLTDMPLSTFTSAHVVVAFAGSVLAGTSAGGPIPMRPSARRDALVVAAASVAILWILLQGFFIKNLDIAFGFGWFASAENDAQQFVLIFGASILKYGMPILTLFVLLHLLRGRLRAPRVASLATTWLSLKLLTLLLAAAFGKLGAEEKLYELSISDFLFVAALMLVVLGAYSTVTLLDLVVSRRPPMPRIAAPARDPDAIT